MGMKDDTISRQAAIDAVERNACNTQRAIDAINALPSAQPQRTGRWFKVNGKTAINCSACYHCSWSLSFEDTVKRFKFCPNCGADMRGEQDEPSD